MSGREDILRAAALIRAGELVGFPTETVYGLGANALDAQAVERIFEAKGRPRTSPLIVHVASIEMARGLAAEWPAAADQLTARWWPGPLTIVLRKGPEIPDVVTAGLPTVGLRMPSHPIALDLIRECGLPIAGPSANLFTELSPTTAEHVRRSLGARAAMVLDGGPSRVGIESAVVSLAGGRAVLLRPGVIPQTELELVTGPLGEYMREGSADPAPGMTPRHYSPRTPLSIGLAPVRDGKGVYLYWREPAASMPVIRMPADPKDYAAVLYDTLHRLDQQGLDWIAAEPVPDTAAWAGVRDRLERAAAENE
ncbi:MAG: threonylcarbamoyl-AMP synthase [Bryobacterales bacterium]|nr:threonylcarbamoyl-AMP synthase [Bryobacterales bacterium]